MTNKTALDQIAVMLRDPDWYPSMLEDIAEIVRATGREITEKNDPPIWERH